MRYFECEPGGWTTLEHHRHEHAVIGLRGVGEIQLGYHVYPIGVGDVGYTAPGDTHQLRNTSVTEPFGFVCVVAADRDRPVEVDPGVFLKSAAAKHALQYGMRNTLETQAKHAQAHSKQSHRAVAEGSACEYVPDELLEDLERDAIVHPWLIVHQSAVVPCPATICSSS